jgi:hypothetical protein
VQVTAAHGKQLRTARFVEQGPYRGSAPHPRRYVEVGCHAARALGIAPQDGLGRRLSGQETVNR